MVCRNENYLEIAARLLQELETGMPWHLNIEKNYFRLKLLRSFESLQNGICFGDNFDLPESCKLPA